MHSSPPPPRPPSGSSSRAPADSAIPQRGDAPTSHPDSAAPPPRAPSPFPRRHPLLALLRRLPQGAISRAIGRVAELRLPGLLREPAVRAFARLAGADLDEAARPPEAYPSLSAFFSRALRDGVRSWPDDATAPASPVDGVVGAVGRIRGGGLIQAKGLGYTAAELLASPEEAALFDGGTFVTLYLAPRHYHRIHAPVAGAIRRARAVPGALLPVNAPAVASVARLFPRNERLIAHLALEPERREGDSREAVQRDRNAASDAADADAAAVALVAVGAFNVGRISAAFDPEWNGPDGRGVTNRRGRGRGRDPARPELRTYRPPLPVARGDEIMTFHLGSTVVLLFSSAAVRGRPLAPDVAPGREIRLGAPLFGP